MAGQPSYIPLLESAIRSYSTISSQSLSTRYPAVSNVILTHHHHDHIAGLTTVLDLISRLNSGRMSGDSAPILPKVWKFSGSEVEDGALQEILDAAANQGKFEQTREGNDWHKLSNHQSFPLACGSGSAVGGLEVLHTPGHTKDSICLLLSHPDREAILFSSDTVLGHSTAVFEDLSAYVTSLELCISTLSAITTSQANQSEVQLFCGHGEVVINGIEKLQEYVKHRKDREEQVLGGLRQAGDDSKTAEQ